MLWTLGVNRQLIFQNDSYDENWTKAWKKTWGSGWEEQMGVERKAFQSPLEPWTPLGPIKSLYYLHNL